MPCCSTLPDARRDATRLSERVSLLKIPQISTKADAPCLPTPRSAYLSISYDVRDESCAVCSSTSRLGSWESPVDSGLAQPRGLSTIFIEWCILFIPSGAFHSARESGIRSNQAYRSIEAHICTTEPHTPDESRRPTWKSHPVAGSSYRDSDDTAASSRSNHSHDE